MLTQDKDTTTMPPERLQAFASSLHGELIPPRDAVYEQARLMWNGMIDKRPALIVRCRDASDVVKAVNFARENGLRVAVRGGGHNVAGLASVDGGLVIDLTRIKSIKVDPQTRLVQAAGGVTLGELDAATQEHGLAVPVGVVTATGIAGLTLGGGYGWLRNKYGLTCDNLVAAEVVTADGRLIRASRDENADLLWGLRGGGGNFGVVTEFTFQAHPVGPEVMFVFTFHDGRGDKMKRAMEFYRDFCASAPDEVSTLMALGKIPPHGEAFPAEIHNVPFVLFGAMYAGPVEEGRKALQPLLDFGTPLVDASGVMPYLQAQKAFDADYPDGQRYYWKSLNINRLDEEVIDRLVKHSLKQPSPFSTIDVWHVGGAVARGSAEESAFNGRSAAFLIGGEANWLHAADDEANLAWLRACMDDLAEFSDGSRYLNFPGFQEEGDEMMRKAFGPQYQKLAALKQKYDPTNFFSINQNIKPSSR